MGARTAILLTLLLAGVASHPSERPNILWITSKDYGPLLGAYGHTFADTSNLDALTARGMVYTRAWSNAPVCAPARTAIISGLYPPSTGSQHMRSETGFPPGVKTFPPALPDNWAGALRRKARRVLGAELLALVGLA